jgi:UDP-N-acetyl-alpha-D-muramoyl-L-alanyl-L-glutamate epimerase
MYTLAKFRRKHPEFIYNSYSWKISGNILKIGFNFTISPSIQFHPVIHISGTSNFHKLPKEQMNNIVFHLGMIELFSYWKATCSPTIIIKTGRLDKEQIKWWNKLLINGMGEYFYKNKIDFTIPNFTTIKAQSTKVYKPFISSVTDSYLMLFGGGKDSLVAYEILKKAHKKIVPLWLNPLLNYGKIQEAGSTPPAITVKRIIDPQLIKLNQQGYLNGHVPFSAYLAFLSLIISTISGYKYMVTANEKSSDEANVKYFGQNINHQYSKTWEFEKDFNLYINKYITLDISYFSAIRPLFELQVAKLFSKYPKYFDAFNSCNKFMKINKWCDGCPKCLSVNLLLSPFLSQEKLIEIFGNDLLGNKNLLSLYKQLIGAKFPKPFECVSTYEENKIASYLVYRKLLKENKPLPELIKYFVAEIFLKSYDWEKRSRQIMTHWQDKHNIPPALAKLIKKEISYEN